MFGMKSYLSIIGGLFIVICFVVAYYIGYNPFQSQDMEASSKAYVEKNVPAIISTWSMDALLKRSSPDFLKSIGGNPDLLEQQFHKLSKLGAMQSFGNVKGYASNFTTNQNLIVTYASYVAIAKYEKGEANISVNLVQTHDQWQISKFKVDSPLLHK